MRRSVPKKKTIRKCNTPIAAHYIVSFGRGLRAGFVAGLPLPRRLNVD